MNEWTAERADQKTARFKFGRGLGAAFLLLTGYGLFSSVIPTDRVTSANISAEDKEDKSAVMLTEPTAFPNIKIKNFGQMDEHFYRGAQPKPGDYPFLAKLGIKTIIDLRDDPTKYEKPQAEAAGIRYINLPMDDKSEPKSESIDQFLSLANDSSTWPFYVHCAGGRHRTGLVGAVYRFNKYGWNYEQVYKEMKNYDFYSSWGHGPIKDFVYNYYENMKAKQPFTFADMKSPIPPTQPLTEPPPPKPNE